MEINTQSMFGNAGLANLLSPTNQDGLAAQSGIQVISKAKTKIQIITSEGDKITFSSKSKTNAEYISYDSRGILTGSGSTVSSKMYSLISTQKVSISVEGDLNDQEIADIQNLLQQVEDIFTGFITGDENADATQMPLLSMDSFGSLSFLDADLKFSQKIRMIDSAFTEKIEKIDPKSDSEKSGSGSCKSEKDKETASDDDRNREVYSFNNKDRHKVLEKFKDIIHESHINKKKMIHVLSRFIPGLIEKMNDTYKADEDQKKFISEVGREAIDTVLNS